MTIPFQSLNETINNIKANGRKGILAADESIGTIGKRFAKNSIESTYESRRSYRELLFTTPDIGKSISGIILSEETLHQSSSDGTPFPKLLEKKEIVTGIKVDKGTISLPFFPGETLTEGLDGLRDRLSDYKKLGAHFAKWRAVLKIGKEIPSEYALITNAQIISRYAALCQEAGIVPIVEPEVLIDGNHTIEQCEKTTTTTLEIVFHFLHKAQVALDTIILKPNMVVPGKDSSQSVSSHVIAEKTLASLSHSVPAAVPVVAFLSGGQHSVEATENLNAICSSTNKKYPWFLTFSFSRALQEQPLSIWNGKNENMQKAQSVFLHRITCNSAAVEGNYNTSMEST